MKHIILSFTLLCTLQVFAAPVIAVPELPTNACLRGPCTDRMKNVLTQFNETPHPVRLTPGVYSGECNYLGGGYGPDHIHYSAILIDYLDNGTPFFSTIFAFFYPENPYAGWDIAEARKRTTDVWREYGKILESQNASRVEVYEEEGVPASAYYMRQDPQTETIHYITYMGFGPRNMTAFCTLAKNLKQ